jgi:hypothetical protein
MLSGCEIPAFSCNAEECAFLEVNAKGFEK